MSEKKRRGLGRGLGALIPGDAPTGPLPSPLAPGGRPAVHNGIPVKTAAPPQETPADNLSPALTPPEGSRPADLFFGTAPAASRPANRREPAAGARRARPAIPSLGKSFSADTVASTPAVDASAGPADLAVVPGARFAELPIGRIHPNEHQPRHHFNEEDMAELVHSISTLGLLQPIVVRPSTQGDPERPYELIMGERRWRASRQAGLQAIPAIIRSTSDTDMLRDALLENLHRSDLNALEEAAAYQQLMNDFGGTHDELAERIGRSRPQITNTLRLLKLPAEIQAHLIEQRISAGHARALLGLKDISEMEPLAQRIIQDGLSVRSTENAVARLNEGAGKKTRSRDDAFTGLSSSLGERLGTPVKISMGARKGRMSIEFKDEAELERLLAALHLAE